ncbi:MAG: PQQ-dependent sugar dehydrogenase [Pirellulaceae bacterium]
MSQIVRAITVIVFAATFCQNTFSAEDSPASYKCIYSISPVQVDGILDESIWRDSLPVGAFLVPAGNGENAKAQTVAKLAWDVDYLYFAAEMEDAALVAKLKNHDDFLWHEDVFELFFRPSDQHQGYYEFQVNPLGTTFDIYWPSRENQSELFKQQLGADTFQYDVVAKPMPDSKGWQVEGRIRWRDMMHTGGRPGVNEIWKFALCRYDYLPNLEPELSSSAALTKNDFHSSEDYRTIQFIGPAQLEGESHISGSKVIGAPVPPPPFKAVPKYEHFELGTPMFIAIEPGTDEFIAITQDNPDGKCRIVRVNKESGAVVEMLKMKDLAYNLCFHPNYEDNGQIFFGTNDVKGADSKCHVRRYTVKDGVIDPESHKLIVEWPSNGHNGAAVTFGHDGMLYVTTGDGTTDSDTNLAGQQLDHLLAKLLRLDVDNAPADKGYVIPEDNPFVGRAGTAPETYAYGLRNPWRMTTDARTGQIWIGNNGQDLWEQIYLVKRAANWGWSVYEGSYPFYLERQLGPDSHTKPAFEHPHSEARSITGGIVYQGDKYPSLRGAYIYGDYSTGKIWAGRHNGKRATYHQEIADSQMAIADFVEDPDGDILVLDYQSGGAIYSLVPNDQPDYSKSFPKRLSDSGIFADLSTHTLSDGAIPYDVNSPLWSDGAGKSRYIVLIDEEDQITARDTGPWGFPEKSVLVKSFSLEMTEGDPSSRRWIETRFLTKQDNEWVGYSYRWNKNQTDAVLVADEGRDEAFQIKTLQGAKTKNWHYPSRSECMMCHSRAANYVLGLHTVQLNKDVDYGSHIENQLSYLQRTGKVTVNTSAQVSTFANHREMLRSFDKERASAAASTAKPAMQQRGVANDGLFAHGGEGVPKLAGLLDETASIETRARSYIFSNCAQCHVGAGGGNSQMHFEFSRSLTEMNVIGEVPLHGSKGVEAGKLITPGNPDKSVLFKRISIRGTGQMPIIATTEVDEAAVSVIRQWIEQMEK